MTLGHLIRKLIQKQSFFVKICLHCNDKYGIIVVLKDYEEIIKEIFT